MALYGVSSCVARRRSGGRESATAPSPTCPHNGDDGGIAPRLLADRWSNDVGGSGKTHDRFDHESSGDVSAGSDVPTSSARQRAPLCGGVEREHARVPSHCCVEQ
jgi:hypothetical protein